uniref:SH2 domain-containing protein n=1 Tax=Ditylenchus dipsaci TaxID=166011 RepID=A0A915EK18_9BILA
MREQHYCSSEGYCSADITSTSRNHIYKQPEDRSQTNRNRRKRAAKESPTSEAGVFTLSWNVEWCGSFPIGRVNAESISKRLDLVLNTQKTSPSTKKQEFVVLSVSLQSVSVHQSCSQQQREKCAAPVFSHCLRKIMCVVGRVESRQIAYITREAATQRLNDVPYKKQIHVFRTKSAFEVEQIETILSNAFQRSSTTSQSTPFITETSDAHTSPPQTKPPSTARRRRFGSILSSASNIQHKTPSPTEFKSQPQSDFVIPGIKYVQTPLSSQTPAKRQSFLEKSRRQMSLTNTLFHRLFGGASSSAAFANRTPRIEEDDGGFGKENVEHQNNEQVRFRRPLPVTPCIKTKTEMQDHNQLNGLTATPKSSVPSSQWSSSQSRKRRPVSAVFGHAVLSRLSSASTALHWGTNSAKNTVRHLPCSDKRPVSSPLVTMSSTPRRSIEKCELQRHKQKKPPALVFDEKLGEWIYPIDDECTRKQLEELAYFCKNTDKELVYARLRSMFEGAFVLRLSGSRKRCLALSVRVAEDKNPNGLAHYLIVRNEQGFRIKGSKHYFASIPMLITHHTVISEQLPCRLVFSEWDDSSLLKIKSRSAANLSCLDSTLKSSVITTSNVSDLAPLVSSENVSVSSHRPKSTSTSTLPSAIEYSKF